MVIYFVLCTVTLPSTSTWLMGILLSVLSNGSGLNQLSKTAVNLGIFIIKCVKCSLGFLCWVKSQLETAVFRTYGISTKRGTEIFCKLDLGRVQSGVSSPGTSVLTCNGGFLGSEHQDTCKYSCTYLCSAKLVSHVNIFLEGLNHGILWFFNYFLLPVLELAHFAHDKLASSFNMILSKKNQVLFLWYCIIWIILFDFFLKLLFLIVLFLCSFAGV